MIHTAVENDRANLANVPQPIDDLPVADLNLPEPRSPLPSSVPCHTLQINLRNCNYNCLVIASTSSSTCPLVAIASPA